MTKFKFKVNDIIIVISGRYKGLIGIIRNRNKLMLPGGLRNDYFVRNLKSRATSTYEYWMCESIIQKLKFELV